jgi:hypothetical protein
MALAAGVLANQAVADDKKDLGAPSGFLKESTYANMEEVRSPSGEHAKRWIAPGVSFAQYDAVMLDKTVFHPEPQPTEQLGMATLHQIAASLDEAFRRELQTVVRVVDKPGPNVLRLRPAITAAAAKDEGLKPYQLLPVAFVLTMGQTTKRAVLALEYEVTDTATGQLVAAGMREGEGAKLKTVNDTLTLAQMQPAIDVWAKDAAAFMQAAKAAR